MFEELRKLIEQHDSIVIFGHPYPDGDCYGSQIGLRDVLRLNYPNKKVYAVGSGLRRYFDFISRMDVVDDEVIKNSCKSKGLNYAETIKKIKTRLSMINLK